MAAFRHPGLVSVHAIGSHEGLEYIVMERLSGVSLVEDLRRRKRDPYPIDAALAVLTGICEALAVLHDAGLAHRDLTPSNVMLGPRGRVVVMDYGVVRCEERIQDDRGLTGTPLYMAPESVERCVAKGKAHLVDVYALGTIAHEMLAGRPPFHDEAPETILWRQVHEPPVPLQDLREDVPPRLSRLVLEMLDKSPDARPPSVADVAARLSATRAPERPRPARR